MLYFSDMKIFFKTGSLIIGFLLNDLVSVSQSNFGCDLFCVTNVTLNTTEELWYVDIVFDGVETDFINYPYVSQMINTNGEIVAVGSMEYFGQIGGTTTTYHPALNIYDPNFQGTVYFVYDSDTCSLSYPCQAVGIQEREHFPVMIQTENELFWNTTQNLDRIELFSASGVMVAAQNKCSRISTVGLSSGIYLYQYFSGNHRKSGRVWIR